MSKLYPSNKKVNNVNITQKCKYNVNSLHKLVKGLT